MKMGRCLSKAHWYPGLPELALVGNEGQVIKRGTFEWDIVESSLQVHHADPLSPPDLCQVKPHVIELVLVLCHLFIDRHDILHTQ